MKKIALNNRRAFGVIFVICILSTVVFAADFASKGFTPPEFSEKTRNKVLADYFPPDLTSEMLNDARSITERFEGVNLFSSAQYGNVFIAGEVDLGDVFDARIPKNYEIFKNYARDNLLILNPSEKEHYNRYALAATRFLKEMDYDAVIFYPDEFHPLHTNPDDEWIFVRENPNGSPADKDTWLSGRIRDRRLIIKGGLPLEPLNLVNLPRYYVPVAGSKYDPYVYVEGQSYKGFSEPDKLNKYEWKKPSDDVLKMRKSLGIVDSPISGTKDFPVGAWFPEDTKALEMGFTFGGSDRVYTWGDQGFYLIPLKNVPEQR